MSTKTFTVTGVSTLNGVVKVRFANDLAARVKILSKNEHSEIRLIELDEPMTKVEAARHLYTHEMFADTGANGVVATFITKNDKEVARDLGIVAAVVVADAVVDAKLAKATKAEKKAAKAAKKTAKKSDDILDLDALEDLDAQGLVEAFGETDMV